MFSWDFFAKRLSTSLAIGSVVGAKPRLCECRPPWIAVMLVASESCTTWHHMVLLLLLLLLLFLLLVLVLVMVLVQVLLSSTSTGISTTIAVTVVLMLVSLHTKARQKRCDSTCTLFVVAMEDLG